MFKRMLQKAGDFCSGVAKKVGLAVGLAVGVVASAHAEGSTTDVTLPDVGVNIGDYISKAVTTLGGNVGIIVGAVVLFFVIRKGLQMMGWIK